MSGLRKEARRSRSPRSLDVHAELYVSVRTHETIRVACDCPIGHTHTYDDGVERTARPSRASS